MTPFIQGLGLGAGLIVAIGAQNAFVLRQGLRKQQVLVTALVCALCDAALITLGVAGFGAVVSSTPALTTLAAWGGAAFLFVYGLRAFFSALRSRGLEPQVGPVSAQNAVLTTLAVSLLNPHVYLDTVVLLGGIGAQFVGPNRLMFGLGAVTASSVWFFSLAYGATRLGPLFRRPLAWRVLDVLIGVVMWSIAASLVRGTL
ncbi:MAG: Arginine exporter protein ArgO [uncultured Truepera sp.]|uniref:Arginine exporter protein ArgO n=1 Tax=uncultured Truepera sp. TaxID=543023 RepID=A0A6J4VM46_9DEIN|nr:MAG: Arginine exporter protein ArgO [uncultured Truepera sp.]